MRALRWSGASLLVLLAGLLGLVGVVLSVTVILLPLGIPVLFLARRLFRSAGQLVVPRAVRHPVDETHRRAGKNAKRLRRKSPGDAPTHAVKRAVGGAASAASTAAGSTAEASKKVLPGRRSKSARLRAKLHLG